MNLMIKQIVDNPAIAIITIIILMAIGKFSFNRLINQFETIASELKDLIASVNVLSGAMALSSEKQDRAFESIAENKMEIKQMRERLHVLGGEVSSKVDLNEEKIRTLAKEIAKLEISVAHRNK